MKAVCWRRLWHVAGHRVVVVANWEARWINLGMGVEYLEVQWEVIFLLLKTPRRGESPSFPVTRKSALA